MVFKNIYMAAKLGVPARQILTYAYRSAVCGVLIGLVMLMSLHIMLLWWLGRALTRVGDFFQDLNYYIREWTGLGLATVERIEKWHAEAARPISKRMREERVTRNYERDVEGQ